MTYPVIVHNSCWIISTHTCCYRQLRIQQRIKLHVHLFLSLLVRGVLELCWDVAVRYRRLEQGSQGTDEVAHSHSHFNTYILIIIFMITTLENKPFLFGHLNGGSSKPFLWFCEFIPSTCIYLFLPILCKMQENTSFFQPRSSSIELTFLNVRPEIIIISNYF